MPREKPLFLHSTRAENMESIFNSGLRSKEGRGTLTKNLGLAIKHLENSGVLKSFDELDGPISEPSVVLLVQPQASKIKRRLGSEIEVVKNNNKNEIVGFPAKWISRNEFAVYSSDSTPAERRKKEKLYRSEIGEESRWQHKKVLNIPAEEIVGHFEITPELLILKNKIFTDLAEGRILEQEWQLEFEKLFMRQQASQRLIKLGAELTEQKLASVVVEGICEHYIVNLVRKLYLAIMQKKHGAKIIDDKHGDKYPALSQEVDELLSKVEKLNFQNLKLVKYKAMALIGLKRLQLKND